MIHEATIIFIGRSGSGKGTQVELLKNFLEEQNPEASIFHFESGAHFRKFIEAPGYTSELMRSILGKGKLAPDFITGWLLVEALVANFKEKQTLILDGFPRTQTQALMLDSAMEYYNRENIKVIHIDVSEDEVRRRMRARGRVDDANPDVIESRISWYNQNVIPTINYLRMKPLYEVIDINGEQPMDVIQQEIRQRLGYIKNS
jgi:adenylate kinase